MYDFVANECDNHKTMLTWEDREKSILKINVPTHVITYIHGCLDRFSLTTISTIPKEWLLDFSGFWDKKTFPRWAAVAAKVVLTWTGDTAFATRVDLSFTKRLNRKKWYEYLPKKGRICELYTGWLSDRGNKKIPAFDCEFYCVVKFIRNAIEHYNDHQEKENRRTDEEICEIMDRNFGGELFFILRETMKDVLFGSKNIICVRQWEDLISPDMRYSESMSGLLSLLYFFLSLSQNYITWG